MSHIDWAKAPEWATHALVKLHNPGLGGIEWSCLVDGEHRVNPKGLWFHPDGYRVVGERPVKATKAQPAVWIGEGFPPIGTVCDFMSTQHEGPKFFEPVEVMYISDVTVVARRIEERGRIKQEFLCHPSTAKFRPIRTPEQIAAEERLKAIESMRKEIGFKAPYLGPCPIAMLYDRGYRKFEIVGE